MEVDNIFPSIQAVIHWLSVFLLAHLIYYYWQLYVCTLHISLFLLPLLTLIEKYISAVISRECMCVRVCSKIRYN